MTACASRFRIRRHRLLWPRWTVLHCERIANHGGLHQRDVGSPLGPIVWLDGMAQS